MSCKQRGDPPLHDAAKHQSPARELEGQPVKSVREFDHAMTSSKKDDPTLLLVNREGNTMFVAV